MRQPPLVLSMILAATAALAADAPLRPERLRQAMGLNQGQWTTVSRIVDARVEAGPGVLKADVERVSAELRATIGKQTTMIECLENSADGLYFPGMRAMPECEFSRVEARNGRFALAALCTARTGSARLAAEGAYSSERMTTRSEGTVSTAEGNVRMKFESEGRFTGKCELAPTIELRPGAVAVPQMDGD